MSWLLASIRASSSWGLRLVMPLSAGSPPPWAAGGAPVAAKVVQIEGHGCLAEHESGPHPGEGRGLTGGKLLRREVIRGKRGMDVAGPAAGSRSQHQQGRIGLDMTPWQSGEVSVWGWTHAGNNSARLCQGFTIGVNAKVVIQMGLLCRGERYLFVNKCLQKGFVEPNQ